MTDTSAQYFYNSDLYRLLYDGTGKSFDEETLFKNTLIELRKYKPLPPPKNLILIIIIPIYILTLLIGKL